ncbi:helix-turn-helix domain-containing protein [Bacteroides sp. 519]|uniref:winged helix-turn-helix domain-containing protein n=1 Tax=Bacteroides sp. 519 TaxID=2302937 RepID=UPI0013D0324E|nr:helix-turn-helix domain-containing protein [Bacteroides sp. 519]NDV58502.1 helix-turn-helix domain-containing protein [Bacteroides sp. 519]
MRHKILFILFLIITIVTILNFVFSLYITGNKNLAKKADLTLRNAVREELSIRFAELNIPYAYNPSKLASSNADTITIISEEREQKIRLNDKENITTNKEEQFKQTSALLYGVSIDELKLQEIWKNELAFYISDKTIETLAFVFDGKAKTNVENLLSLNGCKYQQVYYLGIPNDIILLVGLKYNQWSALTNGDFWTWKMYLSLLMIILMLVYCVFIVNRKPWAKLILKPQLEIQDSDAKELSVNNSELICKFKIGDCVFDGLSNTLMKDGQEAISVSAQMNELLVCFLNQPGYFIDECILMEKMWSDAPTGAKERLQKAISNLRKFLQNRLPELVIEHRNKGYELITNAEISKITD